ncbi:MAG: homoserine kinase [Erythrobacter sp.]|nr:homoserine kinase [Erythrobacter sp.]
MAVYTHLGAEELADLIGEFNVGDLLSAKGIAEGVSNSNWLIETTQGRFILTMYERRIELSDLPYFLGLLDHLSAKHCPVPRTIHDREGAAFRMLDGKAVALIEFLPGVSPSHPTPEQAHSVGQVLAQMHLASGDFKISRANTMGFADNLRILEHCGDAGLASIHADLPQVLGPAKAAAALDLGSLPQTNIHADLFPDNVLMLGNEVTGLIDFYFACTGAMALDLATTHAAWSFASDSNEYNPQIGSALLSGYESVRPITPDERRLLPGIAKGAALRFVASRAEDWLDTPEDALVTRKDPMQFVERFRVYDKFGETLFAS